MATSKAQQKATAKYMKKNYDEIKLRRPKGDRQVIQDYAASLIPQMSVNAYINSLIDADMKKDRQ
ncbi:MAG TPA: hypothetical protein VHO94_00895 [Oscillospiraceae bacterium]|nr:hypothetical protein [Oscillospiraceae bacterium]